MSLKLKGLLIGISLVVMLLIITVVTVISGYNNAVKKKIQVEEQYALISVAIETRLDKLELLLNAVTGLQTHVETQLSKITEARQSLLSGGNLNDISEEVESGFSSIVLMIEDNPETFIAVSAYNAYMADISATTQTIMTAKIYYNQAVTSYNTFIQQFPKNIYLPLFGFKRLNLYNPNLV